MLAPGAGGQPAPPGAVDPRRDQHPVSHSDDGWRHEVGIVREFFGARGLRGGRPMRRHDGRSPERRSQLRVALGSQGGTRTCAPAIWEETTGHRYRR